MTRGSTKAVVVSSPSSNQARTCRIKAGEFGLCCGPGSSHQFLCTLGEGTPGKPWAWRELLWEGLGLDIQPLQVATTPARLQPPAAGTTVCQAVVFQACAQTSSSSITWQLVRIAVLGSTPDFLSQKLQGGAQQSVLTSPADAAAGSPWKSDGQRKMIPARAQA